MHQAEEIIEREFAAPDPYADFAAAARTTVWERVRQHAATTDPKTGMPRNRHDRRRAAALGKRKP